MPQKARFDTRLQKERDEYAKVYDIDGLDSPNDKANLNAFLRNQLIIVDLQEEINNLIEKGITESIADIKKLSDAINDLVNQNLALERALAIDRKNRKTQNKSDNPAEYIAALKLQSREFIDQRLTKVYCPDCKIMLLRFSAVHEHTEFELKIICPQCKKQVKVIRKERDVFFDLSIDDRDWRKKNPMEVIQSKRTQLPTNAQDLIEQTEDDIIIGEET